MLFTCTSRFRPTQGGGVEIELVAGNACPADPCTAMTEWTWGGFATENGHIRAWSCLYYFQMSGILDSELPFVLSIGVVVAMPYLIWANWNRELFLQVPVTLRCWVCGPLGWHWFPNWVQEQEPPCRAVAFMLSFWMAGPLECWAPPWHMTDHSLSPPSVTA